MTTTTCLHCKATTTNGLWLCDLCQMLAAKALEFVPVYFRNLARWRPGRAGSRQVPGSRVLYDGETHGGGDRVSRALDEANNDLTTWARMLANDRCIEAPTADTEADQVTAVCRWLAGHLTSISALEWCGEFVQSERAEEAGEQQGIGYHERRLRSLTETVAPGWYAGSCALCESPTYVIPGLTWVTCRGCNKTSYARDHLETILDEARGWVARPKALAEAIVALVDGEHSVPQLHDRIRQWSARERITTIQRTEPNDFGIEVAVGAKRYRLGDVLDVLFAEGQTRTARRERMGA